MKLFACDRCQQLLFFENVRCTRCGQSLAYLPDRGIVSGVVSVDDPFGRGGGTLLQATAPAAAGGRYRLCRNGREQAVCNWAVPEGDPADYCLSCRLNEVIPNLDTDGAQQAWQRLEGAKRRLVHSLLALGLPVESKAENPERGLAFAFLRDDPAAGTKVFTGHASGTITINVAEADDPFRESMRVQMGEAYRTLLGHFRHESGHYYWERLVAGRGEQESFRALFGDERADYGEAQRRHYAEGPPAGWPDRFVSPYASMHPWEDWAETWAHYLHMTDTLETARAHGVALKPQPEANVERRPTLKVERLDPHDFDELLAGWVPLTVTLNSLNRSMGHPDWYPFVLSAAAVEKLRFVHGVMARARRR